MLYGLPRCRRETESEPPKAVAKDWDKLMKEFEGSSTVLVADVDCTAGGQSKCEEVHRQGFRLLRVVPFTRASLLSIENRARSMVIQLFSANFSNSRLWMPI